MKVICEGLFGSHLYQLNTPTSDKDYKGIYMPTAKEILLGTAPKTINLSTNKGNSKNTAEDIDREFYSLKYFIENACKGETFAIDMLHMKSTVDHPLWNFLVKNRQAFYSKNMKAFIGYAQRQAAKYSIKGSRLAAIDAVLSVLGEFPTSVALYHVFAQLPESEFSKLVVTQEEGFDKDWWHFNGKKFNGTTPIYHVQESLTKMRAGYGHRAELAKKNEGVDWKAISHAFRAAYQLRDIFNEGDFEYPLKESRFIFNVKSGTLDFMKEVQGKLEDLIDEVLELSEKSDLPSHPDIAMWEDFIYNVYEEEVLGGYLCKQSSR